MDVELFVDVGEVRVDGAGGKPQLFADALGGAALGGKREDLGLLGREAVLLRHLLHAQHEAARRLGTVVVGVDEAGEHLLIGDEEQRRKDGAGAQKRDEAEDAVARRAERHEHAAEERARQASQVRRAQTQAEQLDDRDGVGARGECEIEPNEHAEYAVAHERGEVRRQPQVTDDGREQREEHQHAHARAAGDAHGGRFGGLARGQGERCRREHGGQQEEPAVGHGARGGVHREEERPHEALYQAEQADADERANKRTPRCASGLGAMRHQGRLGRLGQGALVVIGLATCHPEKRRTQGRQKRAHGDGGRGGEIEHGDEDDRAKDKRACQAAYGKRGLTEAQKSPSPGKQQYRHRAARQGGGDGAPRLREHAALHEGEHHGRDAQHGSGHRWQAQDPARTAAVGVRGARHASRAQAHDDGADEQCGHNAAAREGIGAVEVRDVVAR